MATGVGADPIVPCAPARIRGGPTGALRLLDPLTERMVRRSVRGDDERLAVLLGSPD